MSEEIKETNLVPEDQLDNGDEEVVESKVLTDEDMPEEKKVLTPEEKVRIARNIDRPGAQDYIKALFTDFFECSGDRFCRDDKSVIGGVAMFHGKPVTVIGQRKGHTVEENLSINFGMTSPEGYRKALRLMKQAEKFKRPIITFVDTPGAYPGDEAEEHGQGEAIARNLMVMSGLKVPIITIIIGQGNSGGALALAVADEIWMLENSVFSILSPEGFASILWKDSSRSGEACDVMKLTAKDLKENGFIDGIIDEPEGGAQADPTSVYQAVDQMLIERLNVLSKYRGDRLIETRYKKYRAY